MEEAFNVYIIRKEDDVAVSLIESSITLSMVRETIKKIDADIVADSYCDYAECGGEEDLRYANDIKGQ